MAAPNYNKLWKEELEKENPDSTKLDEYLPHIDINETMGLYIASLKGNLNSVTYLLEKGADKNKATTAGVTPIFIASQIGHLEIVKALVAAGADVNIARKGSGITPLYSASEKGHLEIVKTLLEAGADVNKATTVSGTTVSGTTPLFIASFKGHLEIVKALVAAGADMNIAITDAGVTPLYVATEKGHLETVKTLLEAGADVNKARTDTGVTPLYIASEKRHLEIVKTLLEAGADANMALTSIGNTPLYVASEKGDLEIVKALVAAGADVNIARKGSGTTPLYTASERGHLEIVKVLLEAGADKTIRDKTRKTAYDVAKTLEIRKLLTEVKKTELWRGFTKNDAEKLQLLFSEVTHPTQLSHKEHEGRPVVESLYSHCPICLKYIGHEEATCMYMSHNCSELGGFFHEALWDKYKHQKMNIVGMSLGKEVVTWCTLCGRICKDHQHYALESHTATTPHLLPAGAPYESDCRKTNGGGGWPEKLARHRGLLEYAQKLNDEVGKVTEEDALEQLVEEVWNAPLRRDHKLATIAAEKKYNINTSAFPNIPDAGNIQSGAVPVEKRNGEFQIGTQTFQNRNGILYKNNLQAQPMYQEFYKRFGKWTEECKKDIPYTGPLPLVYKDTPEGFEDPTYSGDEENVVEFKHASIHGNPKGGMIAKDMLLLALQSAMQSGERLGLCWKKECTAKLYPQEVLAVIEWSTYAEEAQKAEDRKVYEQYREVFNRKFCAVQLGGKTRRRANKRKGTRKHYKRF
jgi:ankyrin repeat protein